MTAAMPEQLHTVAITGDDEHPTIEFTCHGGRDALCHTYPDCECETWIRGDHEHEFVPHDDCWMKSWFDNVDGGGVNPMPEDLEECGYRPGRSGPINTCLESNGPYIEWEFADA